MCAFVSDCMSRKANAPAPNPREVLERLARVFVAPGAMDLKDPFITLIGVVLSARTRDEQVLIALPKLLSRFPNAEIMAAGSVEEIRACIATIGMNGQKAKHLKGLAMKLAQDFGGKVPGSIDELIQLPGVGRKTASVVMSVVFNEPAIAVDVHVHRIAHRLNWSQAKSPAGVEKDLLPMIPREMHNTVNRVFVKHGRYICLPTNPRCDMCPLRDICPFPNKTVGLRQSREVLEKDWRRREEILQGLREEAIRVHKEAKAAQ